MSSLAFAPLDWTVLGAYVLVVLGIGALAARRATAGGDDFFLAGRSIPAWAAALSLLATMQSAATFVGGPQEAYAGDLTYLATNLAPLVAAVIVAVLFVPAFFRLRVTSVYELVGRRFGPAAQTASSATFLLGRLMASGARLFIVALPFSLVVFGDVRPGSMVASILALAAVAAAYTALGGMRAVIWTDVLQAIVYVGAVAVALGLLWHRLDVPGGDLAAALREAGGAGKLRVLDLSLDLSRPYTLWAILFGLVPFMVAAFGVDQDLSQRLLTCRDARRGAWSVIGANLLAWPVVAIFLLLGLLLFVHHHGPGAAPPPGDDRQVFLQFILDGMPAGLRGLMLAGLFAAAMSSLDSALNAMAAATVADFHRPWRRRRGRPLDDDAERRVSRIAVLAWSVLLAAFGCACVWWQRASGETLITFSLGVMIFAYAGLLAVFLAALLTRRGSGASAIAALATGLVVVLVLQPGVWRRWAVPLGVAPDFTLAFPWRMLVATAAAFAVCLAAPPRPSSGPEETPS